MNTVVQGVYQVPDEPRHLMGIGRMARRLVAAKIS